ncbi:hypothetical protein [Govanella unica]|uniref:DUF429 domain-containing protein n=1 Tax=Govanella unica TaxID=2975056 RepID=A0A9X3Z6J8_9PROT|nr:hypothetical protein [Govania unica]MDA5193083.1 hypothetical protein [Govania unica]
MTPGFDRFIAIDWSGGRGRRHKGIAVAACGQGQKAPVLVPPPDGVWSREAVAAWLMTLPGSSLAGFDFSFSMPFVDEGAYLPGIAPEVPALWDAVEAASAGAPDYYGGGFVARYQDHFLSAGARGALFSARLRLTELACRAQGLGRSESNFHLIGPSQVGLASFAGMRMLRALGGRPNVAIWPFEPPGRLTLVELYTRLFLIQAGAGVRKIRDGDSLRDALAALGSETYGFDGALSDHETDVLVAAAGMRRLAVAGGAALWHPPALSDTVRRTEGWTWGVL